MCSVTNHEEGFRCARISRGQSQNVRKSNAPAVTLAPRHVAFRQPAICLVTILRLVKHKLVASA